MTLPERIRRSGTFATHRSGLAQANRLIVAFLVVGCVGLSVVWFVFVSGHWTVTDIQMNELHMLSREEVASTTYDMLDHGGWKPWDRRNIFLVDENTLASDLADQLFAEHVAVEKIYPNILRLKISERQRSVVLSSKDQLLTIDTQGIVTGDASDTVATQARATLGSKLIADTSHPPVIICELPELATAGYQATRPETVRAWLEAFKTLLANGVRFTYLELESSAATGLKIRSEKGYWIVMDLAAPLQPQIETYKKFIQAQPKSLIVNEYVDVRVPGKIYFK